MEDCIDWTVRLIIDDGKAVARIYFDNGEKCFDHNPMSLVISLEDKPYEEVLESIYQSFQYQVESQTGMYVKDFVEQRSDFRNKILYASDAGVASMGEDLGSLIDDVFSPVVHDLLWVLCILVSHPIDKNVDLLLRQFFDFYGKVLKEAGIRNI